jgi:ligand-binding sensor domain-containing protein
MPRFHKYIMRGGRLPAFVASLPAILLMTWLSVIPAAALDFDSNGALRNYRLDFWGEKDGLPQSRIRRIVQTGDGYLWLGTEGGLARFDGVGFTLFNAKTGDLKDNEVGSLKVDHTGGLWIGTMGGGVTLLKDGVFVSYTTADGLPDNFVRVVDEDPEGNIWFATAGGVGRCFQGVFHAYTTKDGLAAM